jgi:hypothetical protein
MRPSASLLNVKKTTKPKSYDANKAAFSIVQQVTDGTRIPFSEMTGGLADSVLRKKLMQEMGGLGGPKGGAARAAKLNAKQRSEMAKIAAMARWGPKKKG